MKRSFLFISVVLLIVGCNRLTNNDWVGDELQGQVKSLVTTTGEAVQQGDSLVFGRHTYTEEISYSPKGLKTHARTLDEDGSLNLQCHYQHDKHGNMTIADMRDSNDQPIMRSEFEYDDNGWLVKTVSVDPDGHVDLTVIYENDSSGQHIKQSVYDHLGRLVYSDVPMPLVDSTQNASFEYDQYGNWTKKITYHVDSNGVNYPTFMWIRKIEYY